MVQVALLFDKIEAKQFLQKLVKVKTIFICLFFSNMVPSIPGNSEAWSIKLFTVVTNSAL